MKKRIDNFETAKLNLQDIVIGGREFICTTWTESDGTGGGDDIYNTDTKTMSYLM